MLRQQRQQAQKAARLTAVHQQWHQAQKNLQQAKLKVEQQQTLLQQAKAQQQQAQQASQQASLACEEVPKLNEQRITWQRAEQNCWHKKMFSKRWPRLSVNCNWRHKMRLICSKRAKS